MCLYLKAIQLLPKAKTYGMLAFDDHELFELLNPKISCIRQPLEDIAKAIVATLIAQIKEPKKHLPTKLFLPI